MGHIRIASISFGLLLSGSLWVGCRPPETPVESLPDEAATNVEDPTDTAESPRPSDPADAAGAPSAVGKDATAINPPKSARLKAEQAETQINLRSQPTTDSTAKGYGLVGDPVKLLQAAEGEDGLTWYYVRFDQSGAEGWIRGDFVSTSGATASLQQATVDIDSFTTDELFAVGGGGCGMTLWPVSNSQNYIFFNGLPDTGMWMQLDGDMTEFRRTAASGPEFYGQSAAQSFVSTDGAVEVNVRVDVGSETGYESVNIERGTLQLEGPTGKVTEISVEGDAGC